MNEELIERLARALYGANNFVKGWDHPKINPIWRNKYREQAALAVVSVLAAAAYHVEYRGRDARVNHKELTTDALGEELRSGALVLEGTK